MKIALENAHLNGLNNLPLMGKEAFTKVQKYEDVISARTIDLTMDYSAGPAILDNEVKQILTSLELENNVYSKYKIPGARRNHR